MLDSVALAFAKPLLHREGSKGESTNTMNLRGKMVRQDQRGKTKLWNDL